jgi:acyl-CoA synthetase (NDP forming)
MTLQALLRPRSIAVVGATPRTFVGRIALENCRAHGFTGTVVPVNSKYDEVAGFPAAPSLRALSSAPDVVLVQVAAERALDVVIDGLAIGTRNFVVPGGGFTDSGEVARDLEVGLALLAAAHDLNVVGPNCMGVVDLVTGAAPYIGTVPEHARAGGVALVAHSGAIVEAFIGSGGRVPLSTAVSCGAERTTSFADYLRFFATDPATTAVLAFVEGFSDAAGFLAAARALAEAGKQLVVCTVGRSATARDGVRAHSGKLAPSARVSAAALRQAGAVLAEDLDELMAFGEILGTGRRPRGRRMHLVTNSGGEGNLLADLADDAGLELPALSAEVVATLRSRWPRFHVANPIDPWGVDEYPSVYPTAIAALAQEPGDLLVVSQDQQLTAGERERQIGRDLARYLVDACEGTDKLPVFLSPSSQDPDDQLARFCREHTVPLLRGCGPALSALGKLANAEGPHPHPLPDPEPGRRHPAISQAGSLTEDVALAVLADYGVAVPRQVVVRNADEAAEAVGEFDGPVVVKGVAPGLLHKTELGLVQVGPRTPDEARSAAKQIVEAGYDAGYHVSLLVAELVGGDLDVFIGYKRDQQFGSTLMVGLGGVWAELLDEVSVHVGPIDDQAARRLVEGSRVGHLLAHARGGRLHVEGVVAALIAVGSLGCSHSEIEAIDINPLIVSRNRAVAVDAVIQRQIDINESHEEENS